VPAAPSRTPRYSAPPSAPLPTPSALLLRFRGAMRGFRGCATMPLLRALLLCAVAAGALGRKTDVPTSDPPASPADLPLLGRGGAPVMTVDGRVCAFPWASPDGTQHKTCAVLPTAAGDKRLWCKDAQELWGICAAPPKAAGAAAAEPSDAAATDAAAPEEAAPGAWRERGVYMASAARVRAGAAVRC
jgi:hypothetical protein